MSRLPIEAVLPELATALQTATRVVLQAPPGAGKTTRIPLALLEAPWLHGQRIIMLEPRRLATRSAAHYMAASLGEEVGQTVGYRMRMDSRIGPATRIEVVTEGVLTRQLQIDPMLEGVGLVIFDEFHERSLHADLGLALTLEAQAALREDLRILVMSATLDGRAVAALLGDAPVISSEGRSHPVDIRYLPDTARGAPRTPEQRTLQAIRQALQEEHGSLLVFLPGEAEIRRVQASLEQAQLGDDVLIAPLFGQLEQAAQNRAIQPAPPGQRKIVLATTIAETSLTIEGIRVVIDSGLARAPRFDPNSGMSRLHTQRVSRAAAEQRRGRAGRLQPGICYRLWGEAEQQGLLAQQPAEILQADLTPLLLELARWGVIDATRLSWMDPPPAASLAQARELLQRLDALDDEGRITAHGQAMAELPLHPRLAHMLIRARGLGHGALGCELAALLAERDILRLPREHADADLTRRLHALHDFAKRQPVADLDRASARRVLEQARQLRRRLALDNAAVDIEAAGRLLAFAYPDRIALRRHGTVPRFRLANGRGALLDPAEPLAQADCLVALNLDGDQREARVFLAAALAREALEELFPEHIHTQEQVVWNAREQAVMASRQRRLGALVLEETPLAECPDELVLPALLQGIRQAGLDCLPWNRELRHWQQRVTFLQRLDPAWPDLSDASLLASLEDWLLPFLSGMRRLQHLQRLDLKAALEARLGWQRRAQLDQLAPSHLPVPSGSCIRLDYAQGDIPVLAVKLQELFGLTTTPRIAGGRVAVMLHLLSPAQRPVQVTQDLASFWNNTYQEVKKDLKGRYPKHPWPDDPLNALPTRRVKPKPPASS